MDEDEKISKLSKRLEDISQLADSSYSFLKYIKNLNSAGDIKLTESETMTLDSWIKQYTIVAIGISKENNSPTIH